NLNRIAELQHVKVLNLHELAKSLRPVVLPGEKLTVRLIKEGREPEQAIAYLDDGTMIVVSQARRLVGHDIEVTIASVLQTAAGRMAFAEVVNGRGRSTNHAEAESHAEERGRLAPVN